MRAVALTRGAGALLPLVLAGAAVAAAGDRAPGSEALRDALADPAFRASPEIRLLYAARDDRPLWTDARRAGTMVALLSGVASSGLRPEDYDAQDLAARLARRDDRRASPREAASFEVALTESLLRLVSDLHSGRAPPKRALTGPTPGPQTFDPASEVEVLAISSDPAGRLAALEPNIGVYGRLKGALRDLRAHRPPAGDTEIPSFDVLRPGDRHEGIPLLRRRLRELGDLGAVEADDPRTEYEPATVEAVRRFQRRHALTVDGVVGPKTLRQLRVPIARRIRQIELSLERLRWIPDDLATRVVIVNIPEFKAHGVDRRRGVLELRTPVIVGAAARRTHTPILRAEMTRVVFRPYWNVPPSIARGELTPKERRSPGSLERDDFELVSTGARSAVYAPTAENLGGLASGALRLRQRPGPKNALGRVKFIFPNPHHVYLHDTPARSLFARSRRDFSHGCVRVGDPAGLAEFVLGPQGWTREEIERAMQGPANHSVRLREPVSVLLFYTTAVVQGDGEVHFFDDIYGLDRVLEERLERAARRRLGSGRST